MRAAGVDPDDVTAFLMLQVMGYFGPREDWPLLNAAFLNFRQSSEWAPAIVAAAQRRWRSVCEEIESATKETQ